MFIYTSAQIIYCCEHIDFLLKKHSTCINNMDTIDDENHYIWLYMIRIDQKLYVKIKQKDGQSRN